MSIHKFSRLRHLHLLAFISSIGLMIIMTGSLTSVTHAQAAKPRAITVNEAQALLQEGKVMLFDVREPQEFVAGIAANEKGEAIARMLPMSQLATRMQEIPNDPAQPVLLICRTQNRSAAVAQTLAKNGYTNITYINGGMKEWYERKLPTASIPKP